MFKLTTISLILFITTAFNLIVSFISWQRRKKQVGFYFALGMLGVTFWTLAAGLDYAAVPIPLKVFFAKLEYTGYNFAFVFFAFFALSYAGYEHWLKDIRLKVFFVIILVSNILLAWTNDWTGWLWISFTRSDIGENTVIFEHGPGYLWAAVTGYLMILAIIVPLWQASRNGSEVSRRQARLIFFAAFVPVVGNLVYLFEAPQFKGVDWSSISFSISGILFLLALYGTRFLDIVPIARDQLVSSLRDSMVVLDMQNRIIDINQVAASMFGSKIADLIGKNLADVAPLSRSYLEQPPDQEIRTELEIGTEPKRYFDVHYSPLRDDRQNIIGRLIVFHDITERRLLEAERESMITELKKRNAESESLRETTVIVTSTLDVSEVVQKILGQLKRVIAYDSASVWLYKGTTAHMMGGDGIPDMSEEDKHYTLSEADPDYPLWAQKLPYVLYDDIQIGYAMFREPPINYIRGWMAIPLKVRERLIGFISLDSKQVGYFTHADAQLAVNYANQVSIAFENARLFSNLQDELYERQELINELDVKNSELERFTYAVSHDLKSPLVTAKWFMDYLKDDIAAGNETRVQTDIQRMSAAMDIMQKRIDGILDIARAGWLSNMDEVINLNELIAEALELVHGRISKRGITVFVDEKLPKVLGNRLRLLEVIQNLLDNAAKFMGNQTSPRIEVGQREEEEGNPVFFIKDNGMGISPDQHERIFGIFNKLDPKAEGTGIGLSLVKKIIEIHGGRIWIESETGMGSTFYFTLPRG